MPSNATTDIRTRLVQSSTTKLNIKEQERDNLHREKSSEWESQERRAVSESLKREEQERDNLHREKSSEWESQREERWNFKVNSHEPDVVVCSVMETSTTCNKPQNKQYMGIHDIKDRDIKKFNKQKQRVWVRVRERVTHANMFEQIYLFSFLNYDELVSKRLHQTYYLLTGKKPGGMPGPPGMPSWGGNWFGLGAEGFYK